MKQRRMGRRPIAATVATLSVVALLVVIGAVVLPGKSMDVLQPGGVVAEEQLQLLLFTVGLGMTVVIPVFILLFTFAWRYRDGAGAKHSPNDEGNTMLETIWWGIPIIIITILSVVTWVSTHNLDPYKPIAGTQPPVEVQVVSLNWKWLFIYPEQRIASVNELYIPVDRPIQFMLAGDSPMSAMWIPKLGSQIYAMKGMSTQLNLKATEEGVYRGSNTNISGSGYADMHFKVHAVSRGEWNLWLKEAEKGELLNWERYQQLAEPSRADEPKQFALVSPDLYNEIVMQYMGHGGLGVPGSTDEYEPIDHSEHGGGH